MEHPQEIETQIEAFVRRRCYRVGESFVDKETRSEWQGLTMPLWQYEWKLLHGVVAMLVGRPDVKTYGWAHSLLEAHQRCVLHPNRRRIIVAGLNNEAQNWQVPSTVLFACFATLGPWRYIALRNSQKSIHSFRYPIPSIQIASLCCATRVTGWLPVLVPCSKYPE